MVSLKVIKKLLLLCLLASTPSFGAETYACFEKGVNDPEPIKLIISGSDGSWRGSDYVWELHTDSFCDASENRFVPETGLVVTACFDRQGPTMHELVVSFSGVGGAEDEHFIAAGQYRCIELD